VIGHRLDTSRHTLKQARHGRGAQHSESSGRSCC
jgi:hypothetical protein